MPLGDPSRQLCLDLFTKLDRNKNGVLDKMEMKKAAKYMHSFMPPQARWRWTEMGRPTRFREEHRATEVKASTCYQRRSVIGTELPIKKSKSSVGEAHE